jgi:hypothetical protein
MMLKRFVRTIVVAVVGATMVSSGAVADYQKFMDYWNSNDGDTGGYVEIGYTLSSINDFDDKYKANKTSIGLETSSSWDSDTFRGAKLQVGNDFGKVRFDLKLAAGHGGVDSIGGTATDQGSDDGAFAALSLNLYWDIYRFDLGQYGAKSGLFNAALTPYIGAGFGAAAVGLKAKHTGLGTTGQLDHAVSGGTMGTFTAGLLLDVTESVGVTVAYNHTKADGIGRRNITGTDDHTNKAFEAGLRYTF